MQHILSIWSIYLHSERIKKRYPPLYYFVQPSRTLCVTHEPSRTLCVTQLQEPSISCTGKLVWLLNNNLHECLSIKTWVCFIVKNKGGERGGEDEKEKEKKKEGDSTLLQAMPSRRPRTENFSHKKIKKLTKPVKHQENTQKRLLVFGFFLLVGLVYFPWVGGLWVWNPDG